VSEFYGYGFKQASKEEDFPKDVPFFVGITFHTRQEYTPSYHPRDTQGSYDSVPNVKTWVLKDEAQLQKFVEEASHSHTKFIFYRVEKLGKMSIKVDVDVST
jgi:hypothetical protein